MERQEDALNKLWEQSISYNGTINFTLADGEQEDASFLFLYRGKKAQINKWELKENILRWYDCAGWATTAVWLGLDVMNLLILTTYKH